MLIQEFLRVAVRHLDACCARTLSRELAAGPRPAHVALDGGVATLVITLDCQDCGSRSIIRTDGISSIVERTGERALNPS